MNHRKKLDAASASRMNQRKHGTLLRRIRFPQALSPAQIRLVEELADRYSLNYEQAATYLDWYAAIHYQWISLSPAQRETGQLLFEKSPQDEEEPQEQTMEGRMQAD